ncbi:hypothetical protein AS159_00875 [Thermotoga sp. Ku-13t]|nr:hypothetical protein AS159_00875 [Thermotoga sp. Ku-13t]
MVLFRTAGEVNTESTLKIAIEEALKTDSKKLLIASSRGYSAQKALEMIPEGLRLIVVTHHVGFKEPNFDEFPAELRKRLTEKGHTVHTATHALSSVERAFRRQYGGVHAAEIVADALRLIGQGFKVCVEIALMAADAGLVRCDEWVVACGGSSKGLDTAVVLKPANSSRLFELKIGKILCMPSEYVER